MKNRITTIGLMAVLLIVALALAACGGQVQEAVQEVAPTVQAAVEEQVEAVEQPTEAPAAPTEEVMEEAPADEAMAMDLACAEPVKVGLITDETGALAIYGAHMLRGFPLGMEYATGQQATEGDGYTSLYAGRL